MPFRSLSLEILESRRVCAGRATLTSPDELVSLPSTTPNIALTTSGSFRVIKIWGTSGNDMAQVFRTPSGGTQVQFYTQSGWQLSNMQTLTTHLEKFEQIDSIHDLHVWSIDGNYNVLTVHVVLKQTTTMNDMTQLKADIRASLETEGIQHATIEFETATESCNFEKCC